MDRSTAEILTATLAAAAGYLALDIAPARPTACGGRRLPRKRLRSPAWLKSVEPCRDDHGRFTSCGVGEAGERRARRQSIGKHRRQMRRRKPKNAEHADWIKHFRRDRREHARDVKRERREHRREQRKERRDQRREHRRTIRDMHREHPRTGSRRGSATRLDVAGQIRADRETLRIDQHAERAARRSQHREDVEGRHRDERESHAEVLQGIRRDRQEQREEAAGKAWRGKDGAAVSPIGETPASLDSPIPTAHDLAERAAKRVGLLDGWRDGTLSEAEQWDVLRSLRFEGRAILRGWAADLVESFNPNYTRPTKGLGASLKSGVGEFFGKVRGFVCELFVAGALALNGPTFDVEANKPVRDAVAALVVEQEKYLAAFQQEVEDRIAQQPPKPKPERPEPTPAEPTEEEETPPLGGPFVARAEQYGAAVYGGAAEIQRRQMIAAGKTEEIRILGEEVEHCHDCPPIAGLGWRPIGTLPRIGFKDAVNPSQCRIFCECSFRYR